MSAEARLLVAGAWRDGAARGEKIDPATGEPAGGVALAGDGDIDDALQAAASAFGPWSAASPYERGDLLKRAAALLDERADHVAGVLSAEGGKMPAEAAGEVARAVETLRFNGEEAPRIEGRAIAGRVAGGERRSLPAPVGVVGAFTAWNFPAFLAARKLGAILAAGCTAVLKAAEDTPRTAAEIVRALHDAGVPPGTVNLLFGDPARVSKRVITAPVVRAVTFTGSTAVGRIVAGLAAAGPKRCVLELGGHAPVIICADGDAELAVRATLPAKFGSAGQSCVAPTRYLVHATHFEAFAERFAAAAGALRVGAPGEDGAQMGPVISEHRRAAMRRLTEDAVARGARLLCGGHALDRPGFFWAPTVLADVPADALIMKEEPFGPVATINRFDDLDDAIAQANASDYAFAAYVFTDSMTARARLVAGLRASNLGINQLAPSMPDVALGGMHDSGYGYEGGRDGIAAFQHLRLVNESTA